MIKWKEVRRMIYSFKRNEKLKYHQDNLKDELGVDPLVLYGEKARQEMEKHAPDDYNWKKAKGFYNPVTNEIYIFKMTKLTQCLIGTLAHEMRHASQYSQYLKTKEEKFHFNKDTNWFVNDKYYRYRRTELDANRYAYRYCKKNEVGRISVMCYLKKKNKWIINRKKYKDENGQLCK